MEGKKKKRPPGLAKMDFTEDIKKEEAETLGNDTYTNKNFTITSSGIRVDEKHGTGADLELHKRMLSLCKDDLERIKHLGQGAGGVVDLMRHKDTGELYALKIIPAGNQEERHMLDTEVSILTKCSSEYLVKTLGAYTDGGSVYIALEFMDVGTIHDLIRYEKGHKLPEPILGIIAVQCLRGLQSLKKDYHVIHRDIKPQNILVNSRGEVKIADFGVSKELMRTIGTAGTWVGTVKYMSPERFEAQHYDHSVDIWSLG